MGALFRPPKIALPQVQPAPEPPELTDEEKARIKEEQDAIERRRRGRSSTILTSPLGLYETKEEKLESLLGK
jgi:hypothetical protein|tara:strand:+ start:50 stop:265 length:216 start_codon:yes stop_codon:yes gene_type:complete